MISISPYQSLGRKSRDLLHYSLSLSSPRLLSTQSDTTTTIPRTRGRIAIGGSKLSQTQQDGIYPSVIATSLQNEITTFESGLNGDEKLKRGYVDAAMFLRNVHNQELPHHDKNKIELTGRFGYRTTTSTGADDDNDEKMSGDVMQEPSESGGNIYHNMTTEYVQQQLEQSSLVHLHQGRDNGNDNDGGLLKEFTENINLTYMAHNPEAQGSEMHVKGAPINEIREFIRGRMTDAFVGLEQGVAEGQITSYGVCSNGLSLPSSHPLHLSWEDMLKASSKAAEIVHGGNTDKDNVVAGLSMIQLPVNLLETHGLKVANRVKDYLASPDRKEKGIYLPSSIRVFAMRPLTCYPDRGTGTGHPFKLVDYLIPKSFDDNGEKVWTYDAQGLLPLYTAVLNETMSHFDATYLLEIKEEEERELTMEERETLDGCKLLQSMIHDLDANLSSGQIRSFAAYEDDLYSKVVPLIHDTFEELDADSAEVLQKFFQVHGNAVRQSIAKTTRQLLKEGGEGVDKHDISDDISLQDFALEYLWKQNCSGKYAEGPLIDKVVVGCPKAEHVVEAVKIADKFDSSS